MKKLTKLSMVILILILSTGVYAVGIDFDDIESSHWVTIPQGLGADWAGNYYKHLANYDIPLKGYKNNVARATALTRGDIARAIAAKTDLI